MDSIQLTEICSRDVLLRNVMLGVFPINKLPKKTSRPCCLIANTKPHTHPGEHWIAIFINKEGYGDYFCSYGMPPKPQFIHFMNRHCYDWNFSLKQLQQPISITCGQYALFFIHCRAKGLSCASFLDLFTSDHHENDVIVANFINGLYDQDTTVYS